MEKMPQGSMATEESFEPVVQSIKRTFVDNVHEFGPSLVLHKKQTNKTITAQDGDLLTLLCCSPIEFQDYCIKKAYQGCFRIWKFCYIDSNLKTPDHTTDHQTRSDCPIRKPDQCTLFKSQSSWKTQ